MAARGRFGGFDESNPQCLAQSHADRLHHRLSARTVSAKTVLQNIALVLSDIRRTQHIYAVFLVERVVELLRHRVQGASRIFAEKDESGFRPAESARIRAGTNADRHSRLESDLSQSSECRCPLREVDERWSGCGWDRRSSCLRRWMACSNGYKYAKCRQYQTKFHHCPWLRDELTLLV